MPCVFSHTKYCDMHFVYGIFNGNACAAVEEYRRHFPDWKISSKGVFSHVHQSMHENCCLPSVCDQSEREMVPDINTQENILGMVQRSAQLPTLRTASHIGLLHMQVWRTVHEQDLHRYHNRRVQHLGPGDLVQRTNFCHWITAHTHH